MYLFLLRKALPFTLTFIFGAALSGLVGFFGSSEKQAGSVLGTRTYEFGSRCRMRRKLVAETKPLVILFKPAARYPSGAGMKSVRVNVTFGSDGKVSRVEPLQPSLPAAMSEAVERAARGIEFTPETLNSVPVSVEKEIEIYLFGD
jgi:hypothetical protein